MKKVALTVAVLALGLAACEDNAADNSASTLNTIETEAAADTTDAATTVDNALDATGNTVDNTVVTENEMDNTMMNNAM